MSEYTFVEKPFLTQLHNLGWDIIEHPNGVIPTDPTVSLRNDFKEVMLKDTFKTSLKKINATDSGIEWLNDSQLEELYTVLSEHSHKELLEANKEVFELLIGKERTTVDRNEITGEEYPSIKFIDFKEPENNDFLAMSFLWNNKYSEGDGRISRDRAQ